MKLILLLPILLILNQCATYQRTKIETAVRTSFTYVKSNNEEAFKNSWGIHNEKLSSKLFSDLKYYSNFADFDFEWPGLDSSDNKPLKSGNVCVRMTFFKAGKCSSCYVRLIDSDYYLIYTVQGDNFRIESGETGGLGTFNFYIGPDARRQTSKSKLEICQEMNTSTGSTAHP